MPGYGGVEHDVILGIREYMAAEGRGGDELERIIMEELGGKPRSRNPGLRRRKEPVRKPYGALHPDEKNAYERLNRSRAARRMRAIWDPEDPVHAFRTWSARESRRDLIVSRAHALANPDDPAWLVPDVRPAGLLPAAAVVATGPRGMLVRNPMSMKKRNQHRPGANDAFERIPVERCLSWEDPEEIAHRLATWILPRFDVVGTAVVESEASGLQYTVLVVTTDFDRNAQARKRDPAFPVSLRWGWRWQRGDVPDLSPCESLVLERVRAEVPGAAA